MFGVHVLNINMGLCCDEMVSIRQKVKRGILGIKFVLNFDLLVYMTNKQEIDGNTLYKITSVQSYKFANLLNSYLIFNKIL